MRSLSAYLRVLDFLLYNVIHQLHSQGNFQPKTTRIPLTDYVFYMVRDFIRESIVKQKRLTSRELLHFPCDNGVIQVRNNSDEFESSNEYDAALRNVQRYLKR